MSDFAQIRFQPNRPLLRELSADRLNTILQEIKRNKPKGERGITVRQDGTGTYIGLAASLPRGGGTSTPTTRQPWDLIPRVDPESDPEDPTYLVKVHPGALNSFLPTNWDEEFECNGEDLHFAKAIIATDGQSITGVTIAIDTDEPAPQQPQEFALSEEIEYLFGLFYQGSVFRTIGNGQITVRPTQFLAVPANPPATPGQPSYDIFYTLQ
jgi:hypothetical protein